MLTQAMTARRRAALVVLSAASFLAVVDSTIVSIALPTIRAKLGFSAGGAQWILNAYTLVFAGMLLLFGRLADRFGRRRAFLAGLLVFGAGSIVAGGAPTAAALVVGRFVQGLGAASFVPSSLSLLTSRYPDEPDRARALAVYGSMAGVGFVVGMVGGGVLTQEGGWRWIFWINVPVVVVLLAAVPRVLTEAAGQGRAGSTDVTGAVTLTAGVLGVVYALTSAPQRGWGAPSTWGIGLASLVSLTAFVLVERRQAAPLVPLPVVTRTRVLIPNAAVILQSMVGIAWLYLLALYFQAVHSLGPLQSGALFAPMSAASVAGAAAAGRVVARFGERRGALTGIGLVAAGLTVMIACAALSAGIPLVVVGMVIGESGFMLTSVALTAAATASLDDAHAGLAAGLFNTSTQLGGGLGLAVVATVIASVSSGPHLGVAAVQYGLLACLGFSALAAAVLAVGRQVGSDASRPTVRALRHDVS